jgi:hypothetical protein
MSRLPPGKADALARSPGSQLIPELDPLGRVDADAARKRPYAVDAARGRVSTPRKVEERIVALARESGMDEIALCEEVIVVGEAEVGQSWAGKPRELGRKPAVLDERRRIEEHQRIR